MRKCWEQHGLTESAARRADVLLDRVVALVEEAHGAGGAGVLHSVLAEAMFRVLILPTRSAEFQKKYLRD